MPTVLTPVSAATTSAHALQPQSRSFGLLLSALLTPLALFLLGYHPFAEDGGLYLAGVKYLLQPSLFPVLRDFVTAPLHYSAFAPFIALLVRCSGLGFDPAIFLLFVGSLWATIFAAWRLARCCFLRTSEQIGGTVLVALWISLPVAGTSLMLVDPYLTARSISTPCTLLALGSILAGLHQPARWQSAVFLRHAVSSLAFFILAAIFHPLMAGYAAAFVLAAVWLAWPGPISLRARIGVILGFALLLSVAVQLLSPPDTPAFSRVALTRSYWFLSRWEWFEILGLVAPLLLLAGGQRLSGTRARSTLLASSFALGLAAILVAVSFARVSVHPLGVAHLQPLRVFQGVYFTLFLALGAGLGRTVLQQRWWRWTLAVTLAGAPVLVASLVVFPHSAHLELPILGRAEPNPWVNAFRWIRGNTPIDALFALDANYITEPDEDAQSFRAIAERSALPDYSKDGGETAVNSTLSRSWAVGVDATRALSQMNPEARLHRLAPLGVTWFVVRSSALTLTACPYNNGAVKVCSLTPLASSRATAIQQPR